MTHRFIDCTFKVERSKKELANLLADITRASGLSGDCDIVSEYEAALAAHFGVSHAIAVSSGTAALHATLSETIRAGEEVLLPVIGVPMTAAAVLQAGAIPVFYDCAPNSFAPDIQSLQRFCSAKTAALITVPMWGYPGINDATLQFANERSIIVIEDAAQALGTTQHGRFEGTIGNVGCFSTHELNLLSTGEGGFVLTNDSQLHEKVRQFSRIGFSTKPGSYGHRPGLNYKLPVPQASLGISQLEVLDLKIQMRTDKAERWRHALGIGAPMSALEKFNARPFSHNGQALALRIKNPAPGQAMAVSKKLFKLGVNTDIHRHQHSYLVDLPMLKQFYADSRYTGAHRVDFPNAADTFDSVLVLPLHEEIRLDDIHIASGRLLSIL